MTTLLSPAAVRETDLFRTRVEWDSFNELAKVVGSAGLRELAPGTIAHLRVKQDAFVLTRAEDFQRLVGLAADASRLQRVLAMLAKGVEIASDHQDPAVLDLVRGIADEILAGVVMRAGEAQADDLLAEIEDDEPAPRGRQRAPAASG